MTTMSQGSSPDSVLRKGNCPGMRNNKRVLGNALLMLTAMIWGTAFVFQRVGMEDIEPITFNASRMALAAVAVGAVSLLPMASEKEKLAIMSRKERAEYRRNTIEHFPADGDRVHDSRQSGIYHRDVYAARAGDRLFIPGKAQFMDCLARSADGGCRDVPVVHDREPAPWSGRYAGLHLRCIVQRPHPVLRSLCEIWKSDPDLRDPVCLLHSDLFYSGPDTGTAKLGQNSVSRHSDPLLRSHLGRTGLYAADHCAEVHRSCCCVRLLRVLCSWERG